MKIKNSDVLSVMETAAALSCSPQTVRNLIRRGVLPAYRVGRVFRVRRADLTLLREASGHA